MSICVLYTDIWRELLKYISLKDTVNICVAEPKLINVLYPIIKNDICSKIMMRLKNIFGTYYNNFVHKMSKSKSAIYGSMILQILLEEKWEGSDIDIYVPYITEYTHSKVVHFVNETSDMVYLCTGIRNDCYYYNGSMIDFCRTKYDTIPQLIERMRKQSDFNICSNYFWFDSNKKANIIIGNIVDIIYKQISIVNKEEIEDPLRHQKYKDHGFIFKNFWDFYD